MKMDKQILLKELLDLYNDIKDSNQSVEEIFKKWLSQGRQIETVSFIYPFLYSGSERWLTIDQAKEILTIIINKLEEV
jgi:hypothetical protein